MTRQERSRIYAILAGAFAPPTPELAVMVETGELRRVLTHALGNGKAPRLQSLEIAQSWELVLAELQSEYYRLFQDPKQHVELAESVYKPWAPAQLAGTPLAKRTGLLMGEPADHLQALYQACGLEVPAAFAGRPDHAALELEFMSLLSEQYSKADQLQFLKDHLDWIPSLSVMLTGYEPKPFYPTVLYATSVWIAREARHLAR